MTAHNEKLGTTEKPRRWYNSHRFPLVPYIRIRKADQYNTKSITFEWLIFKIWTLDHFSFEAAFVICAHWGIGFTFVLPYLRVIACIPYPSVNWEIKLSNFLIRKPKCEQPLNGQ